MPTVQIHYLDPDSTELHLRYRGQSRAQDCYLSLHCESGELRVYADGEVGPATPADVWHLRRRLWRIPALTGSGANDLMDRVAPIAQEILDEYRREWDGHNHVGKLSQEGLNAVDAIDAICERLHDSGDRLLIWTADEYFGQSSDAVNCQELGITAITSDDDLAEIANEELARACRDGVAHEIEGIEEYLHNLRDFAREDLGRLAERLASEDQDECVDAWIRDPQTADTSEWHDNDVADTADDLTLYFAWPKDPGERALMRSALDRAYRREALEIARVESELRHEEAAP